MKAKKVFGLPSLASRAYIRKKHAEMVKEYHPDTGAAGAGVAEKIREINAAYKVLEDFMNDYEYSFSKEAISMYNPEACSPFEDYDDPVWGNK